MNIEVSKTELAVSIYTPSLLIALVHGLVILLIPLFALDMGSSWLGAGVLFALKNAGTLLSGVPAGVAVSRFGEKKVMLFGMLLTASACLGFFLWHSIYSLAICMLMFGSGMGVWTLARLSYLSQLDMPDRRGRAMALLSGVQRTGTFLGPLCGGLLVQYYGYEFTFLFAIAIIATAALVFLLGRSIKWTEPPLLRSGNVFSQLPEIIKDHRAIFLNAGAFIAALRLVRGARQLLLPLWGYSIQLDTAEIGFVFALSAFADAAIMYLGGFISDEFGRKWSGGLCLSLVSLSLIILPWCTDYLSFLFLGLLAGIGNGLGGGIVMTLGADLAPKENRGLFLGVWRMLGDISGTVSPLAVGGLASLLSLSAASAVSGGVGLLAVSMMIYRMQETRQSQAPLS